ncbi:MAG: M48 family metalloprotease [Phycisphaerales bacterium]|nr:M48 family metalloprotease [Phycisphaerales bacterium]
MSVLPLLLVAAVLAADAGFGLATDWLEGHPGLVALLAILPPIVIVLLVWLRCSVDARRIQAGRFDVLPGAALLMRVAQMLVILNAITIILLLDWLVIVRLQLGDMILLDELIAILPGLGGLFFLGLAWFPLERAMAIRHGASVRGPLSFAWSQFSIHVLLLLLPAMIILASIETIEWLSSPQWGEESIQLFLLVAVVLVFLATPLLIRLVLSVKPIEEGSLRDRLEQVCTSHRVRIREILLWRTGGLMINAAVVGMIGRLRYVLLTDMLVRLLPEEQAEAVMAHEVGHVRFRHMQWLFLVIISLVLAVEAAMLPFNEQGGGLLHLGILMAVVWIGLGWVSRRFERQADTFAAVHFTHDQVDEPGSGVTLEAVTRVVGALQAISCMNGDTTHRRSWRHGSIAFRCNNLEKLVGCPPDRLPIDRVVAWIKCATVIVGVAALVILITMSPGIVPDA